MTDDNLDDVQRMPLMEADKLFNEIAANARKYNDGVGKIEAAPKLLAMEERDRIVWNEAIEEAAICIKNNVYHEAQDTDWDLGFNEARRMSELKVRSLKK